MKAKEICLKKEEEYINYKHTSAKFPFIFLLKFNIFDGVRQMYTYFANNSKKSC